jgi:adenylyl cyclase-associated protein
MKLEGQLLNRYGRLADQQNHLGLWLTCAQASSVFQAFVKQRDFIHITTKARKPDMSSPVFMQLLKPLQEMITAVSDIRDANRASPLFNNLSAVSESIGVLAWVTVDPKPHKHIEESLGSAQYWGNRVLKEYKDKYGI